MAYFLSSYGIRSSGLKINLLTVLTVVSDRVVRAFNSSETAPAVVLDISKAFYRFGMLVFFSNLGFVEFRVRYLILFHLFSVTVGFEWFWMGNLPKNIQLMLEFFKAPLLVLHFFY